MPTGESSILPILQILLQTNRMLLENQESIILALIVLLGRYEYDVDTTDQIIKLVTSLQNNLNSSKITENSLDTASKILNYMISTSN